VGVPRQAVQLFFTSPSAAGISDRTAAASKKKPAVLGSVNRMAGLVNRVGDLVNELHSVTAFLD
jgi:hypothetical protein